MRIFSCRKKRRPRGFTLIELLVVISIIGLLASVVLASLSSARIRARDVKRVADMMEVRTALESYYDANGHYPNSNNTWASFDSVIYSPNGLITPAAANLTAALQPYLGQAPSDPRNPFGGDSGYLYFGYGDDEYCFMIYKTPENMKNFQSNLIETGRCTGGITAAGGCVGGIPAIRIGGITTHGWGGGC